MGSTALHRCARGHTALGVRVVGLSSPAELASMPVLRWEETLVDAYGLDQLRRHHRALLTSHRTIVVPDVQLGTVEDFLRHPFGRWAPVKRAADVVVALLLLLLALPLLVVSAAAIRLSSPGRALFRQVRVGTGGRHFVIYKLRTMRVGADDRAHQAFCASLIRGRATPVDGLYKLVDDPRVTRIGRLLRRTSIDELPQLWNVVRGDMSLVGPRPMLPAEVELFTAEHWGRLRVRPGITGAWQVGGRSRLDFQQMIELDVAYWRAWTPRTDLALLARTTLVVLRGQTA